MQSVCFAEPVVSSVKCDVEQKGIPPVDVESRDVWKTVIRFLSCVSIDIAILSSVCNIPVLD